MIWKGERKVQRNNEPTAAGTNGNINRHQSKIEVGGSGAQWFNDIKLEKGTR